VRSAPPASVRRDNAVVPGPVSPTSRTGSHGMQRRPVGHGPDARLATPMDLTILLVTRDRPTLLEHSIRSILASAAAAEPEVATRILVVDDSPEGSAKHVAAALAVEYERSPVRNAGFGQAAARSWAIPRIRTDFVAMFDDDDLMLEDHIGRLAERIRDGADVCSTGFWYAEADPADATKLVALRRQLLPTPRLGDLLAGYQPVNDGAMMRTEVAQSVAWDPAREILMMYHVWLQLLLDGRRFTTNRSATFLYRQHAASVSHNLGEREALLRARLLEEFRARATERFGEVPPPSLPVRLRLARYALARAIGRG